MEMRDFGRTGMRISILGFGCGAVGGLMVRGDPVEQERAVAQALDAGVNYFDTADSYYAGRSEDYLGQALKGRRQTVIVATKVGNRTGPGPNDEGASRQHIFASCEASLSASSR